MVVGE